MAERSDVVIIGSGPSGATWARELGEADPDLRILVLEAGPLVDEQTSGRHVSGISSAADRDFFRLHAQGPHRGRLRVDPTPLSLGGREQDLRRAGLFLLADGGAEPGGLPAASATSVVGGMGTMWFGGTPRPHGDERIPFIPSRDLDAALERAEALLGVDQHPPLDSAALKCLAEVADGASKRSSGRTIRSMPMAVSDTENGPAKHGPEHILGSVTSRLWQPVEIRANTRALRVRMRDRRAVGVEVVDLVHGEHYSIKSDAVVVAADALRTPQLLFASGVGGPALGRYLNDHVQVAALAEVSDVAPATGPLEFASGVMADPDLAALSAACLWLPYLGDDFPFSGQVQEIAPDSLPSHLVHRWHGGAVLSASLFLRTEITASNRIEFLGSPDWAGLPSMRIHYALTPSDRAAVRAASRYLDWLMAEVGSVLERPEQLPAGSSLHYQGTVRMGAIDDGTSVCDPTSRVWGTDNLYVAGNGVIPTATAANPTLTSVALASLGARALLGRRRALAPVI